MAEAVKLNDVLASVVAGAMSVAAASPNVPSITPDNKAAIATAVTSAVMSSPSVAAISDRVESATTPVPWYMSAILIAAVVSGICSMISAVWGIQVTPETQSAVVNAAPGIIGTVASVVALIARFRSDAKPITK